MIRTMRQAETASAEIKKFSGGQTRIFRRRIDMPLTAMLKNRSTGESRELINSSDIPDGTKTVTVVVAEIRESPEGFNAPAIMFFEKPVFGKSSWAVNKTNMKMLIKWYGDDETKLVGKKIKLEVIKVRNPQTGEIVSSLAVAKP